MRTGSDFLGSRVSKMPCSTKYGYCSAIWAAYKGEWKKSEGLR